LFAFAALWQPALTRAELQEALQDMDEAAESMDRLQEALRDSELEIHQLTLERDSMRTQVAELAAAKQVRPYCLGLLQTSCLTLHLPTPLSFNKGDCDLLGFCSTARLGTAH
jgi:hypothetical protein